MAPIWISLTGHLQPEPGRSLGPSVPSWWQAMVETGIWSPARVATVVLFAKRKQVSITTGVETNPNTLWEFVLLLTEG